MIREPGRVSTAQSVPPEVVQGKRRVPVLLVIIWSALCFNVLPVVGGPAIFPLPETVSQLMNQGSVFVALGLALIANPRVVLRPNPFLLLMAIAVVVALMVSIHNEFFLGSTYRALRLLCFLAVLWLLTPWWGRRDLMLLRCHVRFLWIAIGSVVLGVLIQPDTAFAFDGRLAGVIWPIWPTQVAHFAAVLGGVSMVLWMCRVVTGRYALVAVSISGAVLFSTHTRTALVAATVGLVAAVASLFLGHVRVRRTSALAAVAAFGLAIVFASQLTGWLLRGQTEQEAMQLTGRTKVWSHVFEQERPLGNDLFGSGMSDQSFNGLPIDSSWVATYFDQGWFGVAVQAVIVVTLLAMAVARPRGPQRGIALFLVLYCIVASITETGLGIPSPYLLDLTVAAALLAPQAHRGRT